MLSATENGALLLWDGNFIKARLMRPPDAETGADVYCHAGAVHVVRLERADGCFVTGGADGKVCWWDFETIAAAEIDADKSLDFHLSPSDEAVVGEGVVVGHRDYGPVTRVRRVGDGALHVECRRGSFLLRPASCSTDVVLAVLRALSSV